MPKVVVSSLALPMVPRAELKTSDEISVSARLESLEKGLQNVTAALGKLSAVQPVVPAVKVTAPSTGTGQGSQNEQQTGPATRQPLTGGLGQPLAGQGQWPQLGLGRHQAGLGQPRPGLGQSQAGLGQPQAGLGQPQAGLGEFQEGLGQFHVGLGQHLADSVQHQTGHGRQQAGLEQQQGGLQQQFETWAAVASRQGMVLPPWLTGARQKQYHGQNRVRDDSSDSQQQRLGVDKDGFHPVRNRKQRKIAVGSSNVEIDEAGEAAPIDYYVGGTTTSATETIIEAVLMKCAKGIDQQLNLKVLKVEQLGTQNPNPRTKAWKVTVPFRFKELMEKDELYPCGWSHRRFFGPRRSADRNSATRKDDALIRQVLQELEKERGKQAEAAKGVETTVTDQSVMDVDLQPKENEDTS